MRRTTPPRGHRLRSAAPRVAMTGGMIAAGCPFATTTNVEPAHWRNPVTPESALSVKRHTPYRAIRGNRGGGRAAVIGKEGRSAATQ